MDLSISIANIREKGKPQVIIFGYEVGDRILIAYFIRSDTLLIETDPSLQANNNAQFIKSGLNI